MAEFVKISELKPEDKSKLRSFWTPLYGSEYAAAMVEDYSTTGKKKEVKAQVKK